MHVRTFIDTETYADRTMASTTPRSPSLDRKEDPKAWANADHVENRDDLSLPPTDQVYDSIEDTRPSKRVWLITVTVAMGGFLFGKLPPPGRNHSGSSSDLGLRL